MLIHQMNLYHDVCRKCSKLVTNKYSTSFSLGIKALDVRFHDPIYAIYGFVRFADEIVDTFHDFDKAQLLEDFKVETYKAISNKISLNPILHAFQEVVNQYNIERELIDAFLESMEMDLFFDRYECSKYKRYIYGSAEVVGLMCLRVFVEGDEAKYEHLKAPACSLGAAFQKVNFLRDMKSDYHERGRVYFPGVNYQTFQIADKKAIELDIDADFKHAYQGIIGLPNGAKFGVYTAYKYYLSLFNKIKKTSVQHVLEERIRIPNNQKFYLLCTSAVKNQLRMI